MEGGLITPPALIGTGPLMGVTSLGPGQSWQERQPMAETLIPDGAIKQPMHW
jgi:hypothetical protein